MTGGGNLVSVGVLRVTGMGWDREIKMGVNECCDSSMEAYDLDGELGFFEQGPLDPKSKELDISTFKCKQCKTNWRRSMSYQVGAIAWENCGVC